MQVGEALRGLVGGDVVLFFEGGADGAKGLTRFPPLPDEAAGGVAGVVVRVALAYAISTMTGSGGSKAGSKRKTIS